jgi:DNA-directed RNA polymerase subunit RPC12/RpoP
MEKRSILQQIFAPVQQWLLEQGKCVACGGDLSAGEREPIAGGEVITCPCGEQYFHLPKAQLYKRLFLEE